MLSLPRLFLFAILAMALHGIEQLAFGLDELYELRAMTGAVLDWSGNPDVATVLMVFAVTMLVLFFCYGFMAGGVPRLIATTFFGLEFMGESHHIIKTVVRGEYFPGAVSAGILVILGALILRTAWTEFATSGASVNRRSADSVMNETARLA